MKKHILEGLVVANLIVGFNVQSWAQQPAPQQADIGKTEYQSRVARRAMALTEKERDRSLMH